MAHVEEDRIRESSTTTGTSDMVLGGAVIGYRTFASVMSNNDTCFYCISSSGGSEWEIGLGTYVSASTTLARTTVISSSTGSKVSLSSGTKDVFITASADRLLLPQMTSDPPAPASGVLYYTRQLGGRWLPRWIGPAGLDCGAQPGLYCGSVKMWLPGTGTAAPINFGTTWTVSTTQSHPTIASTNFMAQMTRAVFTTTTTAANTTGVRSSAVAWMGNAAGVGGFFFAARFGITTYYSTMRVFVGLAERAGALASDPNVMSNACGMAKNTGMSYWYLIATSNTTSCISISTGKATASAGASGVYDFFMFAKPNDSVVTFSLCDITDNTWAVVNQTASGTVPGSTAQLTAHAAAQNVTGGTGTAVAIFLSKIYIETDS